MFIFPYHKRQQSLTTSPRFSSEWKHLCRNFKWNWIQLNKGTVLSNNIYFHVRTKYNWLHVDAETSIFQLFTWGYFVKHWIRLKTTLYCWIALNFMQAIECILNLQLSADPVQDCTPVLFAPSLLWMLMMFSLLGGKNKTKKQAFIIQYHWYKNSQVSPESGISAKYLVVRAWWHHDYWFKAWREG